MIQLRGLATAAKAEPAAAALQGVKAGLILSRTPIVTPDTPEFEKKFYHYQEELERRLMWTFPKWYYFKKGTVAEEEFTKAQKYPLTAHRGVWFPRGTPDLKHGRDRRFKQDVVLPRHEVELKDDAEVTADDLEDIGRPITPNSRVTEADKSGDLMSLERQLPRTLYLLVKDGATWKFPSFAVKDDSKPLDEVAEDGLRELGGNKINTWTVSHTPAAVVKDGAAKEFLLKSHIVAGKFDPQQNGLEYQWLVKEEVEKAVSKEYWAGVGHLLSKQ